VGAYDRDNRFADFSNYGPVVDLLAPGVELEVLTPDNPGLLAWDSGTSVAAPHVAGAVVRLLAKHPTMTPGEVSATLNEQSVPLVTDVPNHTTNKSVFVGTRQAFEDANHNGVYDADEDVLVDPSDLRDGQYTTNGNNSLVIPAAVGPIVTQNQVELRTNGNLIIRTALEGASSVQLLAGGYVDIADVSLSATNDQVLIEAGTGVNADAATLNAQKEVFIRGEGRMYFPEAALRSKAERIEFDLAGSSSVLTLDDATLLARKDVIINSEADVSLMRATVQATEERASIRTTAQVVLSHATVDTGKEIVVNAGSDIAAEHAALTSANEVVHLLSTSGAAYIALQHAALTTPKEIEVETSGTNGRLSVEGASFRDNDDRVRVTPSCLPVDGSPASGQVADACGS